MATNNKRPTDEYTLYDHHAICESKSGNTYLITYDPLACNCKGFGYYSYCRHSKYVSEHHISSNDIDINNDVQITKSQVDEPPVNAKQSHIDDMVYKLTHKREG